MAWTSISASDVTVGEVIDAATDLNIYAANLRYLKGADGAIVWDDAASIGATSTAKTLTVYGNANGGASGPIVLQNTSAGTVGTALTLDATNATGGRRYSFISTANGASVPGAFSIYDSTAGAYRFTITSAGYVGIGNSFTPNGPLHIHSTLGDWIYWDYDGLDGTVRNILPAGGFSGGVIYSVICKAATTAAVLSNNYYQLSPAPPTSIQLNGANPTDIRMYFNADGSIDTRRSSGPDTAKVSFMLRCL